MRPVWLYLDADGFFASCEEAADPVLHGRPVGVVAGEPYPDAPLIAVNTVAKRAGVRSGDRLCDARLRCPGFAVRPQRVERYVQVHDSMVGAVERVLPVSRVHSIDEVSAQLSPREHPETVVDQVRASVTQALTPRVPVSVAVASSAWLAKTAAEANKPSAAVVWRPRDIPGVYADLELEDLPGAGARIRIRLRSAGLDTVRSIHDASRSQVIAAWGSIQGERVRLALRGHDVHAPVSARRSVAHGRVLSGPARSWREGRPIVRWLAVAALCRCVSGGQLPRVVRLEVVTEPGGPLVSSAGLDPPGVERALLRALTALWDACAAACAGAAPVRVGVVLERLVDVPAGDLFRPDLGEDRLQGLLDTVRERYGAPALLWGRCQDRFGPYTGAKIAYGSFPDAARLRWLGVSPGTDAGGG